MKLISQTYRLPASQLRELTIDVLGWLGWQDWQLQASQSSAHPVLELRLPGIPDSAEQSQGLRISTAARPSGSHL